LPTIFRLGAQEYQEPHTNVQENADTSVETIQNTASSQDAAESAPTNVPEVVDKNHPDGDDQLETAPNETQETSSHKNDIQNEPTSVEQPLSTQPTEQPPEKSDQTPEDPDTASSGHHASEVVNDIEVHVNDRDQVAEEEEPGKDAVTDQATPRPAEILLPENDQSAENGMSILIRHRVGLTYHHLDTNENTTEGQGDGTTPLQNETGRSQLDLKGNVMLTFVLQKMIGLQLNRQKKPMRTNQRTTMKTMTKMLKVILKTTLKLWKAILKVRSFTGLV
jgi:hypothetical protein